jgi:hypothetical protein
MRASPVDGHDSPHFDGAKTDPSVTGASPAPSCQTEASGAIRAAVSLDIQIDTAVLQQLLAPLGRAGDARRRAAAIELDRLWALKREAER